MSEEPLDPSTPNSPEESETEEGPVETNVSDWDKLSVPVQQHYEKIARRLFMFPSALIKELNELIDSDTITSSTKLKKVIQDRYKGTLPIPSLTAIRAYVLFRQKQKAVIDKAKQNLLTTSSETLVGQIGDIESTSKSVFQDLTLSIENKKRLLEDLIQLCQNRINAIRVLQEADPTASYESVLGSYIREVRSITETLVKLRSELKTEGEHELDLYIVEKLSNILRVVLQAYTATHGQESLETFKSSLKNKLKENKMEGFSNL